MSAVKLPVPEAELTREDKILRGMDGFISAITGAGFSADKFPSYQFSEVTELDQRTLEALYTDHDLAATIVERIVKDALRSGYELDWQGATDQQRRDVVDWAENEYQVTEEVRRARIYSRLYGGGAVFMGVDGLLENEAFMGSPISFLRATPSSELKGNRWFADPGDQNFGQVFEYLLTHAQFRPGIGEVDPSPVPLHHSRIIPFYGIRTTDAQQFRDKGWGKSVLHRVYDVLKKFDSSFDSVLHTLSEQSIPVYKVKALLDLLASENGELLAKRFELINVAKSSYRAVILDMEEVFERVEASLSQASNIVDSAMLRVTGAAGMPVTILFGREPAGQNATGKSDLENWNQQVASEQSLVLGPGIRKVFTWLLAQETAPLSVSPEDLKVVFPAVETPTFQEMVNNYAQVAGADATYEAMGAVTASEIAIARAQSSELFPKVDLQFHRELDDMSKERLLNPPEPFDNPEEPGANSEETGAETEEDRADFGRALTALLHGQDIEITY